MNKLIAVIVIAVVIIGIVVFRSRFSVPAPGSQERLDKIEAGIREKLSKSTPVSAVPLNALDKIETAVRAKLVR